jgi:hypothetical protein
MFCGLGFMEFGRLAAAKGSSATMLIDLANWGVRFCGFSGLA